MFRQIDNKKNEEKYRSMQARMKCCCEDPGFRSNEYLDVADGGLVYNRIFVYIFHFNVRSRSRIKK